MITSSELIYHRKPYKEPKTAKLIIIQNIKSKKDLFELLYYLIGIKDTIIDWNRMYKYLTDLHQISNKDIVFVVKENFPDKKEFIEILKKVQKYWDTHSGHNIYLVLK